MGLLDDLFRGVEDNARFNYLRASALKDALKVPKNIDALLGPPISVPGNPPALKRLSPDEKLAAIVHEAKHLSSTPTAFLSGSSVLEILSYSFWYSDLSERYRIDLFGGVKKEDDLLAPVVNWLKSYSLQVYREVELGRNRADVIGYKPAGLIKLISPAQIVSVELKNSLKESKRAADQLSTYRQYSSEVYLACTPDIALENVEAMANGTHVKRWVSSAFDDKIKSMGCGLLIVEGGKAKVHLPVVASNPKDTALAEVLSALKEKRPL